MNTEQQLRHAADEMERATASLTPPPIAKLHRTARMRTIGVSVATAIGVVVLIGGAVLMLRPSGITTLEPAAPTDTTSTTQPTTTGTMAEVLVLAGIDAEPQFDLTAATEVPWLEIEGGERAGDVSQLHLDPELEAFGEVAEVLVLGRSGSNHVYVARGEVGGSEGQQASSAECLLTGRGVDWRAQWCGDGDVRGMDPALSRIDGSPTWSVAGRAAEGSSIVVLEIGADRYWQRTKDGYAFVEVVAGEGERVGYVVYDSVGNVLEGHVFYEPQVTDTTAAATEDDGNCSGRRFFPDIDTSGLPEPVVQTLGKITLFGSRCWFDELAAAAGDEFTASFGGDDAAELWAYEEEQGYEPMYHLMRILDMPPGTTETDNGTLYTWPAAAAHDGDWATVPEEDKEALRALYDDEDFAGFESFGGYIGYRIGIWEDGVWSAFVVGD